MASRFAVAFGARTMSRYSSQAMRRVPLSSMSRDAFTSRTTTASGHKPRWFSANNSSTEAASKANTTSVSSTASASAKQAAAPSVASAASVQIRDVMAFVAMFVLSGLYLKYEIESNPLPERKPPAAAAVKDADGDAQITKA